MKVFQIHPTMNCNRNCSFCSYRGAYAEQELPWPVVYKWITVADEYGFDAIKVSGGGEPLLYSRITSLALLAKACGMYRYLQTNGDELSFTYTRMFDDIRVSYSDEREFEDTMRELYADGFSYVVTAKPDYDNLNRLVRYAIANGKYVKVIQDETNLNNVPDIRDIQEHLPENELLAFWDAKDYSKPTNGCPSDSPLLGADGNLYPCCRTQYSNGKQLLTYDKSMKCKSLEEALNYDGRQCTRCYY